MHSIRRNTIRCLFMLILAASAARIEAAQVVEKEIELARKGETAIRGTVAPRSQELWHFVVSRGKEARVRILKGRHMVIYDVYDAENLAADEGVGEGEWFPVSAGRYTITVTNATGLGEKGAARQAPYEIAIEIR